MNSTLKKIAIIMFITAVLITSNAAVAQERIENFKIYGFEPLANEQSEGRTLEKCLAGWRTFLSALVGYEDFVDYWRDFLLWPSHYADVANVQNQLNKARYAVMAAFFQCDLERFAQVAETYYRLEAELYYVRHYVETGGGYLKVLTENHGDRAQFKKEMIDRLILRKNSPNAEADRQLFNNYFNSFEATYKERAKRYKEFFGSASAEELKAKYDKLLETFALFGELGSEFEKLGDEAIVQPYNSVKEGVTALFTDPPFISVLKVVNLISSRLDFCATTEDDRYCLSDVSYSDFEEIAGAVRSIFTDETQTNFQTFEQVMYSIKQGETAKTEDFEEADMLKRYELLYGQVSGQGVSTLVDRMDKLLWIIGNDDAPGSIAALEEVRVCAEEVQDRECK